MIVFLEDENILSHNNPMTNSKLNLTHEIIITHALTLTIFLLVGASIQGGSRRYSYYYLKPIYVMRMWS